MKKQSMHLSRVLTFCIVLLFRFFSFRFSFSRFHRYRSIGWLSHEWIYIQKSSWNESDMSRNDIAAQCTHTYGRFVHVRYNQRRDSNVSHQGEQRSRTTVLGNRIRIGQGEINVSVFMPIRHNNFNYKLSFRTFIVFLRRTHNTTRQCLSSRYACERFSPI